jgi:hypothetical protein
MSCAAHRVFSTWVHSRSLRSPGRLARLALRPRAVGRQGLWTTWKTLASSYSVSPRDAHVGTYTESRRACPVDFGAKTLPCDFQVGDVPYARLLATQEKSMCS